MIEGISGGMARGIHIEIQEGIPEEISEGIFKKNLGESLEGSLK